MQRSLSVSDVVVLHRGGAITSHYVDSTDFKELPAFLGEERQPVPASSRNGNTLDGPTVAELEQTVKEGGQISLMDLARAVKQEQRPARKGKPSVLARLQEFKQAAAQAGEPPKAAPNRHSGRDV